MRIQEMLGGIYIMISEEENELVETFFSEKSYVSMSELNDRQILLAETLVKKGLLYPTARGFKIL